MEDVATSNCVETCVTLHEEYFHPCVYEPSESKSAMRRNGEKHEAEELTQPLGNIKKLFYIWWFLSSGCETVQSGRNAATL